MHVRTYADTVLKDEFEVLIEKLKQRRRGIVKQRKKTGVVMATVQPNSDGSLKRATQTFDSLRRSFKDRNRKMELGLQNEYSERLKLIKDTAALVAQKRGQVSHAIDVVDATLARGQPQDITSVTQFVVEGVLQAIPEDDFAELPSADLQFSIPDINIIDSSSFDLMPLLSLPSHLSLAQGAHMNLTLKKLFSRKIFTSRIISKNLIKIQDFH